MTSVLRFWTVERQTLIVKQREESGERGSLEMVSDLLISAGKRMETVAAQWLGAGMDLLKPEQIKNGLFVLII